MERILISGASGYIGCHLIEKLKKEKYELFVIVRPTTDRHILKGKINEENIIVLESPDALYHKIKKIKPYLYIHLMGVFYEKHNNKNIIQLIDSNIRDALLILDAVNGAGCKKVINTASYWQNRLNSVYSPVNLYAATKQAFETLMTHYVENENMSVITLTIFDTYGPQDQRGKIISKIYQLKDGDTLELTSGEQKLYLCHIDDVVSGYLTAIKIIKEMEGGKALKYALRDRGKPIVLKDALMMAVAIWGKHVRLNFGSIKQKKIAIDDPTDYGIVLPGWEAKVRLEDGLKDIMESNNVKEEEER